MGPLPQRRRGARRPAPQDDPHLVAALHRALLTPPLDDRILASITRTYLLEDCDGAEAVCTLDDVRGAEEAFIASTVREVMPISVVDDIELPQTPGPVTRDAHERFVARVRGELAAV